MNTSTTAPAQDIATSQRTLAERRVKQSSNTTREQYMAETQADILAVGQFVKELGQALGLTFTQSMYAGDETEAINQYRLTGENTSLFIHLLTSPASKAGRLAIGCDYPRNSSGDIATSSTTFTGTVEVGPTRTPEQAAKEVAKRILPYHRPAYVAHMAVLEQHNATTAKSTENLQTILRAAGHLATPAHSNNPKNSEQKVHLKVGESYATMRIDSANTHFDMRSLPVELAVKMLECLRDYTATHSPKK